MYYSKITYNVLITNDIFLIKKSTKFNEKKYIYII